MRLSVIQRVLWGLAGTALLAFAAFQYFEPSTDTDANASNPAFYADFELTNHRGLVQTDEYFAGRWMLVFFGFANCPDVCPTTLAEVAAVMEDLGTDAEKVQPIFISIDPERDTPAALAEYVPLFNAGIIGLTGTPEQIAETSETFPIFFERIEEAAAPDGYTMGHTSHLFLFRSPSGLRSVLGIWHSRRRDPRRPKREALTGMARLYGETALGLAWVIRSHRLACRSVHWRGARADTLPALLVPTGLHVSSRYRARTWPLVAR